MNDQFYIYPAIRQAVSRTAICTRQCASCLLGFFALLLLFALLSQLFHTTIIPPRLSNLFSLAGALLMHLCLIGCALVIPWCHTVLLDHRGALSTRFLSHFNLFLAATDFVCTFYTTATGNTLLAKQDELPLFIASIIFFSCLFNVLNMLAAGKKRICQIILASLFLLIAQIPSLLALVAWPLALFLLIPLLKQLAAYAPLIISMPEKQQRS